MERALEDIMRKGWKEHYEMIQILALMAFNPSTAYIEIGTKSLQKMVDAVRVRIRKEKKPNNIIKTNCLAAFINDAELVIGEACSDIAELAENITNSRKNNGDSLALTLLYNLIASELNVDGLNVLTEGSYYAPNFRNESFSYSIFLKNQDNKGETHKFKNSTQISTFKAMAELALRQSRAYSGEQSKFLLSLSRLLERYTEDIENRPILVRNADVGNLYKKYRLEKGLLQKQVAEMIGRGRQTLSDYEAGLIVPPKDVDKQLRAIIGMPLEFEKVGEEYAFYRKKRGIYQEEVAKRIGKSRSVYSQYERGDVVPDAKADHDIRNVLGIPSHHYYIGDHYRKAREAMRLSQNAVAIMIGMSKAAYWSYENGKVIPDVYTAMKLKKALRMS